MPKLRAPILSFLARGRLGRFTSYRDGPSGPQAIATPTHPDAHTWPQIYHRFDYQDYIAWWNTLTPAEKLIWHRIGAPKHQPGMAAFLATKLKARADQSLILHLDYISGTQTSNSSPNANNATLTGGALQPGVYQQALAFNGVDEYANAGNDPSLQMDTAFTLEFYVKLQRLANYEYLIMKGWAWDYGWWIQKNDNTSNIMFNCMNSPSTGWGSPPLPLTLDKWEHIIWSFDGPNATLRGYRDGQLITENLAAPPSIYGANLANLYLGGFYYPFLGLLDEVRFYNRPLTSEEAAAHYARNL